MGSLLFLGVLAGDDMVAVGSLGVSLKFLGVLGGVLGGSWLF